MRLAGSRSIVFLLSCLASACGESTLPPYPEALLVVDTNLPVPLVAARLRVDLYSDDGTWFDSTDFGRPDPRDWPASFSVYSDDETRERHVWVRLRVYPEGASDTYAGERLRDLAVTSTGSGGPFTAGAPTNAPRLVVAGHDVTPGTEPSPLLTVDRFVLVPLKPNTRGSVHVLLDGSCVGTMSKMGDGGVPRAGEVQSCVDTPKERSPVELSALSPDMSRPTTTAAGTWLVTRCPEPDPEAPRICVPGGATILGSRENAEYIPGANGELDPAPPRVYGLHTFFVDRDELSVKELRDLVNSGYTGALPEPYEGTLAQPTTANKAAGCTWSFGAKGRDDYPVTCVTRRAGREICQFRGGDLLTEAQWEHVATIAGHRTKARFPWGSDLPTCDRAVYGRVPLGTQAAACPLGDGPRPRSESAKDLTPLGVRGLFGSVFEWVIDDALPFVSNEWAAAPVVDPVVTNDSARQLGRGNSWFSDAQRTTSRTAPSDDDGIAPVGVRCAYPTVAK